MEIESLKGRDILAIADFSVEELQAVLNLAAQLKSGEKKPQCQKILGSASSATGKDEMGKGSAGKDSTGALSRGTHSLIPISFK